MDYVAGQPLDAWIAGQKPSIEGVLRLFMRICEAVSAAHLHGVIHRDLKPGNIQIDPDGEPHILDFGVAKMATAADASTMTVTGQFVGSLLGLRRNRPRLYLGRSTCGRMSTRWA